MKIHFCDLCNESVPQSDLDDGRAFLRKGRVVCANCDRVMSSMEEGGETSSGPFGGGTSPAAVASPPVAGPARVQAPSSPAAAGAPPIGPHPAGAPTGTPPTVVHHHARPARGGGAGLGVAMMALLAVAALGFVGYEQLEKTRAELKAEDGNVARSLRDQRQDHAGALAELRQEAREFEARLETRIERIEDRAAQRSDQLAADARAVDAKLDEFRKELDVMRQTFGEVGRHDQELMRLQQKYSSLHDDVRLLGAELGTLVGGSSLSGGTPAVPVEPAETRPAWMDLVEGLASENESDRWQAVVALGETRDPAVAPHLVGSLEDSDIFIRMVAARVLGDLGSPVAIAPLIDALEDGESAVREAAYLALKTLTGRDLPFDPLTEDRSERGRRIKAWREWWNKEKDTFDGA